MKPKLRVWVTFGEDLKFGDGRARLLALIDERGSLKKAAQALEMSYRNAWGYLRELPANSRIGIDFQQLMSLGRRNPYNRDERFSMAVLALKTSSYRNAVSRLHRQVSQEMFHDLWPQLPIWEVPITSVTNGVHPGTWVAPLLRRLFRDYL